MTKQPLSVTEMFSSIMELLEQAGYAKHTLWGNMYGSIRSVVSFYHEKGICNYDPAVIHPVRRAALSGGRNLPGILQCPKACCQKI